MAEVGKILDYIYVMTYVFSGRNGTVAHQTNLYPSKNYAEGASGDKSMKNFLGAGVPAKKLVLGSCFYGKAWEAENTVNNGLGQKSLKAATLASGSGYTMIKDSLVNQKGYKRYWDKDAKAGYLFNAETKVLVTYDDEASIKAKSKYIRKNKFGGIFFWEYSRDPKEYLLTEINKDLP